MLTGISVHVNVAAIVCALVALPLFIGARRQGFLDKNNLLGLVLLGIAVLLHGGFQTLLRSSPHAVFSGYVLGWSGGSEDRERARISWTPAMFRACGRDAANSAVAEVLRPDLKKSTGAGEQIERVDYRILEVLKGILAVPVLHATFYPSPTAELPTLHQHVIVFGAGGDDGAIFVPLTDSNLREVQAGIAEGAVDIPGSR